MKSYFLECIERPELLEISLSRLLLGQHHPWTLSKESEVLAYINIEQSISSGVETIVSADISGRHYECDSEVIDLLQQLKVLVGGEIYDDK